MSMDGNRLGTDIVDDLIAAGLIDVENEVQTFTVTSASASTYEITIEDAGTTWSRTVSYDASGSDGLGDIADALELAVSGDEVLGELFEASSDGVDTVTTTTKSSGIEASYSVAGNLSTAAGTPELDEDVEDIWQSVSASVIDEISTNAQIGLLDVDLDPVDGTPDGETLTKTGAIS